MNGFKNVVLQREYKGLINNCVNIELGDVGGLSIEVETSNPVSFESYLYNGKTAESDIEHDYQLFKNLVKKATN